MAVDRAVIRQKIGHGLNILSETPFGPSHPAHVTHPIPLVPFDIAGANRLLDADARIGPEFLRHAAAHVAAGASAVTARRRMLRPESGRLGRALARIQDDEQTLELLCDHLTADRFAALPAPTASDALRLCRYNHPDLLLLDLALPDASGLDVLREIRESDGVHARYDPRLPIIVLTGRSGATLTCSCRSPRPRTIRPRIRLT